VTGSPDDTHDVCESVRCIPGLNLLLDELLETNVVLPRPLIFTLDIFLLPPFFWRSLSAMILGTKIQTKIAPDRMKRTTESTIKYACGDSLVKKMIGTQIQMAWRKLALAMAM